VLKKAIDARSKQAIEEFLFEAKAMHLLWTRHATTLEFWIEEEDRSFPFSAALEHRLQKEEERRFSAAQIRGEALRPKQSIRLDSTCRWRHNPYHHRSVPMFNRLGLHRSSALCG
jgi:hypothetical protein